MAVPPTSRRRLLSLALFTSVSASLPAGVYAIEDPAWLTGLSKQLEQLSHRMSRKSGTAGEVEFHCEMQDAAFWGASVARLTARGTPVRAQGNVLTFSRSGKVVRLVMSRV
jgi:hypothetical protein